jgi:hypothetical protein
LKKNPRHPGLKTHKFTSITGPNGEEIFEAYAENKILAAYRIFWHYGPKKTGHNYHCDHATSLTKHHSNFN